MVPDALPYAPGGDYGIANATFHPIKTLEPQLDKGCLIVRHHFSEQRVEGYI
jgi:hypothetical protein